MSELRVARISRVVMAIAIAGSVAGACGAATTTQPTGPSTTAVASSAPTTPAPPSLPQPPVARLAVAPQPAVDGALGSYTWLGAGSDSPWLPGAAVALPAGRTASITLEPAVAVASWRIRSGTATGDALQPVARGNALPIEFVVPDVPRTLQLTVEYGPAGSAVYYWAVTPVGP